MAGGAHARAYCAAVVVLTPAPTVAGCAYCAADVVLTLGNAILIVVVIVIVLVIVHRSCCR